MEKLCEWVLIKNTIKKIKIQVNIDNNSQIDNILLTILLALNKNLWLYIKDSYTIKSI